MAKEFKIIIAKNGTTTIKMEGLELESPKIAKDFEEILGAKPSTVQWKPKQHLGQTVKVGS